MERIEVKSGNRLKDRKYAKLGKSILDDPHYMEVQAINMLEVGKKPSRTDIINYLLSLLNREVAYLEIGVRNPNDNFNHINAKTKYSVDPGVEFEENPVDFKMTSDAFFEQLGNQEILSSDMKFDVIFIDGLHLADQVDRDIKNALQYIKDDGFIVLHDCNPPTEWHARTAYNYYHTPAKYMWNGTTWKAFQKWRFNAEVQSCCIDSDWGVGILSKTRQVGQSIAPTNPFYEYAELAANRKTHLNLMDFESFKAQFV